MIQTATMPLCHISRWRSETFIRMPAVNMTFWRCGILTLTAAADNRLTTQKLGSQYVRLSALWVQRIKKTPPPIPLWSPCASGLQVQSDRVETDTRTIDQAVRCEADPNRCVFSNRRHPRRISTSRPGFHTGGKLLGWDVRGVLAGALDTSDGACWDGLYMKARLSVALLPALDLTPNAPPFTLVGQIGSMPRIEFAIGYNGLRPVAVSVDHRIRLLYDLGLRERRW